MKIVGIVGSTAEKSYNRLLLQYIQREFTDLFDLEILEIDQIPLFNQDNPELATEGPVHTLNRKIRQADGVIIATAEHNHTTPGPLKSALEWLSFTIHPLKNKPVKIIGASYLDQGTSRSQLHLRQILEAPGIDALVMPGQEFLLGNCKEAINANGDLVDPSTVSFLKGSLEKFMKYVESVQPLKDNPVFPEEDLTATKHCDTTIEGVDMTAPDWVEQAAEKVGAVEGETYVKLDRGLLTVNQLNWFLKTIPLELTYADENNQYIYYNRVKPGQDMFASRYEKDVGSPLGTVHPPRAMKNVSWVISQLRSGNMEGVHVHVPIHKDNYVVHNYVAMHDEEGKYRGINEHVLDLQPVIDWYLAQTGQKLVKIEENTTDASTSASMNGAWSHDDKNTVEADAESGASDAEVVETTPAASGTDEDTSASQS